MENNQDLDLNEENFLHGKGKENPFHVPKDYFETLADRIQIKMECEEELKEFITLNEISKRSGFKTPENYFGSSENKLEYQFELSGLKNLSEIKKTALPLDNARYFEALDKKILDRKELNEELKGLTMLQGLEKKNNFAVEPDYFAGIADRIKGKYHAQPKKQTVVVQIWNLVSDPRLAIAASIILVAAVSAIWYANQSTTIINSGDCKTLACLEKNELLKEMTEFDEDNLYDLVDVESLDKQLSSDSTVVNNELLDSTVQKNED